MFLVHHNAAVAAFSRKAKKNMLINYLPKYKVRSRINFKNILYVKATETT